MDVHTRTRCPLARRGTLFHSNPLDGDVLHLWLRPRGHNPRGAPSRALGVARRVVRIGEVICQREERRPPRGDRYCPGRKPPFLAVKCPVRPYKNAIENRLTQENANGA